jgi:CspA family cold shock protein
MGRASRKGGKSAPEGRRIVAVVREWHSELGWGVLDCDATPGGCWAHFSVIEMPGFKALTAGQRVSLEWEPAQNQDGFRHVASRVVPAGSGAD